MSEYDPTVDYEYRERHPDLPYPEPDGTKTAGWSGSETSQERARSEAQSGVMQKRQREVLALLHVLQAEGITVAELREISNLHHGQASSALSSLHKVDRIKRLKERRDKCQVYVLPEHVGDREEAAHRSNRPKPTTFQPGDRFTTTAEDGTPRLWEVHRNGFLSALRPRSVQDAEPNNYL